jgi:hypothetical protein
MKKIHIVGLALVAVLAFSAFSVASASALESTWLVGGAKPAAAVASDSEGELVLEDLKGGLFLEDAAVKCQGTDEGTVGPNGEDKLTKVVVNACTNVKGCPAPDTAAPINLPWNTKVELIGAAFYDDLTSASTVGYTVTCAGFATDTCSIALATVLLKNGTGGEVLAEFSGTDANQPAANCTRGGTAQGLVNGTDKLLTVSGAALAVSEG